MKKILYCSLLLSILQSILFWNKLTGISVLIFVILLFATIVYSLKEKNAIKNKKGFLYGIPIVVLASTYFIFANGLLQLLNMFVILALFVLMCMSVTETKMTENKFIRRFFFNIIKPFKIIPEFKHNKIWKDNQENEEVDKNKKIELVKKIGIAAAITIPVVIVIICLLASADSMFQEMFKGIAEFIEREFTAEKIIENSLRLIMVVLTFFYISGFIVQFVRKEKEEVKEQKEKKYKILNLSSFTLNTLLISLDVVYLLFSIIQIRYLIMNAGKTADFDYAEYARTGFFQLMLVSFINLIVLKISKNVEAEKLSRVLRVLLVVFTMIILVSAIARLYLYEQEYGYTYLRIFVYFALATELLVLIPILIDVCGKKLDVLSLSIKIAVVMYVVLNIMNIDNVIVTHNVDRYLADPENVDIDVEYIMRAIGTDGTEQIKRLLDQDVKDLSYKKSSKVLKNKSNIRRQFEAYVEWYDEYEFSWQEWNLSRNRAREILKDIESTDRGNIVYEYNR